MSNLLLVKPYIAGAAISANTLVKVNPADGTVIPTGLGEAAIGSTVELDVTAGQRVDVAHIGLADVVAGAALAAGTRVMSDAQGRVVPCAAPAGTNVASVGMAVTAATAAGDVVPVQLSPGTFQG